MTATALSPSISARYFDGRLSGLLAVSILLIGEAGMMVIREDTLPVALEPVGISADSLDKEIFASHRWDKEFSLLSFARSIVFGWLLFRTQDQ